MTSSENPYAAPVQHAEVPRGNPLIVPAVFIIVFASFFLLTLIVSVVAQGIVTDLSFDFSTPQGAGRALGQVGFLIAIFCSSVLEIFGAICMLQMKRYSLAMTSAVLSMVPFCSPCYFLGIPFGIWALVVLLRPEVKNRFG